MSDDAYDFNSGRGLASGGGTPDWNNQSQVDGWNAQRNYDAMQASMNPPQSSTNYFPSYDSSPTWNSSSSSDYSYSSSHRGGSYSGGSYQASWTPFNVMILTIAAVVGALIGYNNVPRHAPTEDIWLTTGGGALGAVLIVAAALALIAVTFKTIKFLINGFVSVIRWLIRKVPQRFRSMVGILATAGLLGGAAGYLTEATHHGSEQELWLMTGVSALAAILVVAAAIGVIMGTVAVIRHLFRGLANATRWLVSKTLRGFRAASS